LQIAFSFHLHLHFTLRLISTTSFSAISSFLLLLLFLFFLLPRISSGKQFLWLYRCYFSMECKNFVCNRMTRTHTM
jgi:hypothetical protein